MKNIHFINILIIVAFTLMISGCKEDIKPIGDPLSHVNGLADTWRLLSVNQVDELNDKSDNFIDVSQIIMGSVPAEFTFNADKSFSLDPGTMRNFLPTSGTWAFDDDRFPSKLTLTHSGGETILDMLSPVRELVDPRLEIKYIRPINNCADIDGKRGAVSYEYYFERK